MVSLHAGYANAYEPVSLEAARKSMLQMGMDEWAVNLMGEYFAAYSTNWAI